MLFPFRRQQPVSSEGRLTFSVSDEIGNNPSSCFPKGESLCFFCLLQGRRPWLYLCAFSSLSRGHVLHRNVMSWRAAHERTALPRALLVGRCGIVQGLPMAFPFHRQ